MIVLARTKQSNCSQSTWLSIRSKHSWRHTHAGDRHARNDEPIALDAFIARKTEIDTMLQRLQALSDEHFGYSPDDINWAHVGTLAHYAELLERITDAAFKEGEHAA
jgi:hypothetical protein